MPGLPSAVGASVEGSTSCVQFLPPPVRGANFSSGICTRTVMPLSSADITVALAVGSVDGMTPPPQLFARLSDRSLRLALSAAGPSAATRARSRALPLAPGRSFVERRVLRYAARCLSAVQGLLRARLALRALRRSFAFADFDAARLGRFFVWLTSAVSGAVALTVFVDFAASAWPPSAVRTSRLAPTVIASILETAFAMSSPCRSHRAVPAILASAGVLVSNTRRNGHAASSPGVRSRIRRAPADRDRNSTGLEGVPSARADRTARGTSRRGARASGPGPAGRRRLAR